MSDSTSRPPIHLRPTAPLAERVLLPGDPSRALALAQTLLSEPKMFNHHRGLWGYTGPAADGQPLTIQSTGMGGPSAAIVLEELISLGVARAVRIGTCGAFGDGLALGDILVAREAIAADGTSRALGAGERIAADAELTAALERAALERSAPARAGGTRTGAVVSTDLFYDPDRQRNRDWAGEGAVAVEMEAAALFAVGARHGVPVACALVVSDLLQDGSRERIDDDLLLEAAERVGAVAASAVSGVRAEDGRGRH
jgi:DeoD family purine-nucleoside phosphorylase